MLDLVLIMKDSIPIFFVSKKNDLNDMATAAFISALRLFAQNDMKSDLVSLRLGDLDIRLKEDHGLLFIFGTSPNVLNSLIENKLKELMLTLVNVWYNQKKMFNDEVVDSEKIPTIYFEECLDKFENEIKSVNSTTIQVSSAQLTSGAIKDWDLLPKKLQSAIPKILEHIIIGDKIVILDNDPVSAITRDFVQIFRLPSKEPNGNLLSYEHDILLSEVQSADGICLSPQNGEILGKYTRNKFLEKVFEKEILSQSSKDKQDKSIKTLLNTIKSAVDIILSLENNFTFEQGKIINLLNSMAIEEARLVLLILKKNKSYYYEKIAELPIHTQWFSQW